MALLRIFAAFMTALMVTAGLASAGAAAPGASPKIHFPEERYTFSPVMEGAIITHDFVVENRGVAPLTISQVRTD